MSNQSTPSQPNREPDISIEIVGAPPLLLNSRMHWRTANKYKKEWYAKVGNALVPHIGDDFMPMPLSYGRFTRCCGYRRPDKVNLASGFKWIEDALTRECVIIDDAPEFFGSSYHWEKASPPDKRVRIEIWRC